MQATELIELIIEGADTALDEQSQIVALEGALALLDTAMNCETKLDELNALYVRIENRIDELRDVN